MDTVVPLNLYIDRKDMIVIMDVGGWRDGVTAIGPYLGSFSLSEDWHSAISFVPLSCRKCRRTNGVESLLYGILQWLDDVLLSGGGSSGIAW